MVTPSYIILANGINVTDNLIKNSARISYVDHDGGKSDELTLKVAGQWNMPKFEDKLELYIGYKETGMWHVGNFTVSSTPFNKFDTTIKATAADFNEDLKSKTNRVFKQKSVKEIVTVIAKAHKMDVKCDIEDSIYYLAQSNESDMHFLTRLAKEHEAIFKVKKGLIIFASRAGRSLITIDLNECSRYEMNPNGRSKYKSCEVKYHDSKQNKTIKVTEGDGTPVLRIEESFSNETEARRRAKNAIAESNRHIWEGSITIYGIDVVAGSRLLLTGDARVLGLEFSITKVTQTLGNGFTTRVEFRG